MYLYNSSTPVTSITKAYVLSTNPWELAGFIVLTRTSQSKGSDNSRFGPHFGPSPIFPKPPILADSAKLSTVCITSE